MLIFKTRDIFNIFFHYHSSWRYLSLVFLFWNVFIEIYTQKCVQQPSSRPLFKIGKWPKSANPIGTMFCRYDIQKVDCPKSLKNVILFFTLTSVPFYLRYWRNKRGLELVPNPFLGFKTYLKFFFMQRSIPWPILIFWLEVVSELFRKTYLLIYASHLMML